MNSALVHTDCWEGTVDHQGRACSEELALEGFGISLCLIAQRVCNRNDDQVCLVSMDSLSLLREKKRK